MPTETSKLQTSMLSSKGLRVFQFKFLRLSLSNLQPSFLWAMAYGGSFHSESGPLQFFLLALCICIPLLMKTWQAWVIDRGVSHVGLCSQVPAFVGCTMLLERLNP